MTASPRPECQGTAGLPWWFAANPPHTLVVAVLVALGLPGPMRATPAAASAASFGPISFDTSFLGADMAGQDISRFEKSGALAPGTYDLTVSVNGTHIGDRPIRIVDAGNGVDTAPCLVASELAEWGIRVPDDVAAATGTSGCVDLTFAIPDATVVARASSLALQVSVPQAAMSRAPRGFVDPSTWVSGVSAATFNYGFNAYRRSSAGGRDLSSAYLRLDSGLNLGSWRFRHQGALSQSTGDRLRAQSFAGYATHDLTDLKAELLAGQASTAGELFDSLPFVGMQVRTDDRMYPDSLAGYAPVVRGTARTNARVVIRQNGHDVYEMSVAPGPFVIDDMYPSGFGGDLEVSVMESDGSESRFVVPFASVPRLLRPGMQRYTATAGRLRSGGTAPSWRFVEATYQHGVSNLVTLFGGMQASDSGRYVATTTGAALNTFMGALSGDVTLARAAVGIDGRSGGGHSVRATYSKSMNSSAANISVAALRRSSDGYLSLGDAAVVSAENGVLRGSRIARRNTVQVNLSHGLPGGGGTVFVSGATSDYWREAGKDTTWQAGYNNQWSVVSYSLTASRTRDAAGRTDRQVNASLSIPLGQHVGASRRLGVNYLARRGGSSERVDFSASSGSLGQLTTQASASHARQGGHSWTAGASYQSPYATVGGSVGHAPRSSQQSLSFSGGAVIHDGGVTFAPYLPETVALVHAPDARGARIVGNGHSRINGRGYAVATNLRAYRDNVVTLDPGEADELVHLSSSTQRTAPRAGAVVLMSFSESSRRAYLVRMVDSQGRALPFGLDVTDWSGRVVGTVAQGGYAYLHDAAPGLDMNVQWVADDGNRACRFQVPQVGVGEIPDIPCHAPVGRDQVETPPRVVRDDFAAATAARPEQAR